MTKGLLDYQFELAVKEMEFLQGAINNYNTISLTIKGWAITVVGGLLVFTIQSENAMFILFAHCVLLLSWSLDAIFKRNQRVFIDRFNFMSNYFRLHLASAIRNGVIELDLPGLGSRAIVETSVKKRDIWEDALKRETSMPYISMMVITAVAGLWMVILR